MPSSTKKQRNFMAAIAHNPSFAKKVGVPQSVGKDFNEADKGRKFGRGGKINIQNTQHGKLDMPFKQLNRFSGKKGGGSVKKYARGGPTVEQLNASGFDNLQDYLNDRLGKTRRGATDEQNAAIAAKARFKRAPRPSPSGTEDMRDVLGNRAVQQKAIADKQTAEDNAREMRFKSQFEPKMAGAGEGVSQKEMLGEKKGGLMKESKGMMFMKKKGAPASMMKHEKAEMNMGGMSKYAKGGGIESRGKTKGTMIRMATGGSVGSASRRADGIAQRGKTRC
jgi:hypothetical protein